MFVKDFKFDIEHIANVILEQVEDLLTDSKIIMDDFNTLKNKFAKISSLKKKLHLDSIDLVFVWENSQWDEAFNKDKYKKDISEIYNRLNYKFANCEKIPTFFRSAEGNIPAFHFPSDMNVWFLNKKQFLNSKVKPIVLLNFGIIGLLNNIENRLSEEQKQQFRYYHIDCNDYYNYDKSVVENWNKK